MGKTISAPFRGKVTQGVFEAFDKDAFKRAFRVHEGREVVVSVKRFFKNRTNSQNAYYFGVIVWFFMEAMGESDSIYVHDVLKTAYNYKPQLLGDAVHKIPLSTKTLDTVKFEEFEERCRIGFTETFKGAIPMPNDTLAQQMAEEWLALGNARIYA